MKRFLIALLLCLCLGCVGVFAGCDPSPNQVVQPSNPGGSSDNDSGNNGSIESPDNTENKGDSSDTTPSKSDKDKTEDNTPSEEEKDDDKQEEVPGDSETDNDNEGKTNPSESEDTDPSEEEKSDGGDTQIDDKSEENPDDKEEPNPPIEYVFDEAIQDRLIVMFSDFDFYLGLINLTSVDCTKCSDRLVVTIVVDEPDGAVEQMEMLFEMLPDINPEFGELYPELNFAVQGVDNTVVITVTKK